MSRSGIKRYLVNDDDSATAERRVRPRVDLKSEAASTPQDKGSANLLIPGSALPSLRCPALINQEITSVDLASFKEHWLCIVFYPFDFEKSESSDVIVECSRRKAEFDSLGCSLLYCSTDSCFTHLAWSQLSVSAGGVGVLAWPMLSDNSHIFTKKFDLLDESSGTARPALVIVDPQQTVQQVTVTSSGVGGGGADGILQAVQHLQRSASSTATKG